LDQIEGKQKRAYPMIRNGLMYVDSNYPSAWSCYALGTLARCLYYGRDDFINMWAAWAGADSYVFLPYVENRVSSIVILQDASQALIGCEGTRDRGQMWRQIFSCVNTSSDFCTGKPHAWFHYCFLQRYQTILDALQPLPNTAYVTLTGHSLGGALANIFANASIRNNLYRVRSLVTFGQPRTGDPAFVAQAIPNFTRIANDFDPVPEVPPPWLKQIGWVFKLLNPLQNFMYRHQNDAWVLGANGEVYRQGFNFLATLPPQLWAWFDSPVAYGDFIQINHIMSEYNRRLRFRVEQQADKPNMQTMFDLNYAMDRLDLDPATVLPAISPGPAFETMADPNVIYPLGSGVPHIPPADSGTTIEQRGVAHFLLYFGEREAMARKFRGRDRRLLTTLQKVIYDIQKRDVRALNPTPTRTISSRALMFPSGGTPDIQIEAASLYIQATQLLAATR
jgi:hypothetical protein